MDTKICITGTNLLENIEETNYAVRENIHLDSLNYQTATGYGFIYQVYDTLANPLGWWPFNQGQGNSIKIEYSILVRDTTIEDLTGIEKYDKNNLVIYPNPSNSIFTIESVNSIQNVEIHNILGCKIEIDFVKQSNKKLQIDMSLKSSGIYLIRIIDSNNQIFTTKILKK